MKKENITIIIDFKIYVYLFEPIINYIQSEGVKVFLFLPDELRLDVEKILGVNDLIEYCSLSEIKSKHRLRFALHRTCSLLFTRTDFSFQFKKKREQITKSFPGMTGVLLKISKYTPKVPNRMINRFLAFISGVGLKNPFPTETIIVGSLNASAELLGATNQEIITVMESWDHAVKEPNGYCSSVFLGWNNDLCNDWKRTQGDLNCKIFHPLKLRYAKEVFVGTGKDEVKNKFRVMYPVASTQKFSIKVLVDIERKLIKELIEITYQLGWELYIKPRPNGMENEFSYADEYEHVEVGDVSHGDIKDPANYYYSSEDNLNRFKPLVNIDLVINAFTTFGLDAAVAGLPVLQLDLREAVGFEVSEMVYNNYHIKQYLISSKNIIKPVDQNLSECMQSQKSDFFEIATAYSQELNSWLYTHENSMKAIDECFKEILEF